MQVICQSIVNTYRTNPLCVRRRIRSRHQSAWLFPPLLAVFLLPVSHFPMLGLLLGLPSKSNSTVVVNFFLQDMSNLVSSLPCQLLAYWFYSCYPQHFIVCHILLSPDRYGRFFWSIKMVWRVSNFISSSFVVFHVSQPYRSTDAFCLPDLIEPIEACMR